MKKYVLSLALLIAVSISAKAQFALGIKGGITTSDINTDNFHESSITGYQAGVFARFGSALYVQPELYLASTGGEFTSTTNDYSSEIRFTTLNVPLLFGHTFGAQALNFRIMAGPVYSYIMNSNETFSQNFTSAYHDFGNYNDSTLGYQVGAGIDVGAITFDLRYEGGLTKLNNEYNQRSNIWSFGLGFKIL